MPRKFVIPAPVGAVCWRRAIALISYQAYDLYVSSGLLAASYSDTRVLDQEWQRDPIIYCRSRGGNYGPGEPDRWQMGYPCQAEWMAVDDDGNTVVFDPGSMR